MIRNVLRLLEANSPKRYLKSALWIAITKILSIGISLASTFYIARTLGPQNFGELNYALSIVNLLAFFGAIASSTVICRDLVRHHEQEKTILGTAWVLLLFSTISTIVLIAILSLFLEHTYITLLVIGLLCLAQLATPFQVSQYVFYARVKTKRLSLAQLGLHITISLAKIIAMTEGQGVLVLASIMLLEQVCTVVVMSLLYYYETKTNLLTWRFDYTYAKKLALDSIPYVFITMSAAISGRIDQVFIKHFMDSASVGIYSVAVQLTEIWQVLPQMLLTAIFPAIVHAHTSKQIYQKRIFALMSLLGFYSLAISVFITLYAPFIIHLIYGQAFAASAPLVQIYIWSLFGTIAGFLMTHILVTENKRTVQIVVGLLPMLTNVLLNFIWVPRYGATGAAWATVLSYSMTPMIPWVYQRFYIAFKK